MILAVIISAIAGSILGAGGCYIWHQAKMRQQLRQVLAVMETSQDHEDISLPMMSQLRRRAIINQQQQQDLEQQLFSWQQLLTQAPIGYLHLDAENRILWCNQTAQDLLHIHKWESGKARLLLVLVRSYELDRLVEKTRSSHAAQQLVWQFYPGYHDAADSESIWLKANSIPIDRGAIGVFIESQQTQTESATARERWLADLAHEVRTPLTAIQLVAETLQGKVTPDLTRWVDRMLRETNRLIDLVQHFLELSQLETAPSQYLRLESVDLIASIEDAWHTLEPIAQQRQIEFVYTGPQQLLLEIDRARFIQVFVNLFDNSIKYCPNGGHIWIDIQIINQPKIANSSIARTDRVEINLYDDGNGFAQGDLPYVFDRLYRGDIARQRQPTDLLDPRTTGSGLGLAIVRQIVLAHGGTISAHNHPTTGGAWIQLKVES